MPRVQALTESHDPIEVEGNAAPVLREDWQIYFKEDWRIYRKLVDNNYLFHREAYDTLHRLLVAEATTPFRFLDLACGDASATVGALKGTNVAHYHGIDLSHAALELARESLKALPCPVILELGDFAEAVRDRRHLADIVWIGLSLHHFRAPQKLELMRHVHDIVGENGMFLIYENASPGEETRESWLKRWDLQRPGWHACSQTEWDTITGHVRAADFPETNATWHALGKAAGFSRVRELYVCPTDLFRLYCFQA